VVKKVWVRTLPNHRGIRPLSVNSDHERRTVGPANTTDPGGRPRRAAARTGAGGVREGEEARAVGAPGVVQQGVPAA
jgi:hypothetical protein